MMPSSLTAAALAARCGGGGVGPSCGTASHVWSASVAVPSAAAPAAPAAPAAAVSAVAFAPRILSTAANAAAASCVCASVSDSRRPHAAPCRAGETAACGAGDGMWPKRPIWVAARAGHHRTFASAAVTQASQSTAGGVTGGAGLGGGDGGKAKSVGEMMVGTCTHDSSLCASMHACKVHILAIS
eukprot:359397-Chlamydomonas_euryale.AAC.9